MRKRAPPRTRSRPLDCRVAPSPAFAFLAAPAVRDNEAQALLRAAAFAAPPVRTSGAPAHRHPMSFSRAYAAMTTEMRKSSVADSREADRPPTLHGHAHTDGFATTVIPVAYRRRTALGGARFWRRSPPSSAPDTGSETLEGLRGAERPPASPAPHRSRCSRGFVHELLGLERGSPQASPSASSLPEISLNRSHSW